MTATYESPLISLVTPMAILAERPYGDQVLVLARCETQRLPIPECPVVTQYTLHTASARSGRLLTAASVYADESTARAQYDRGVAALTARGL